MTDLHPFALLAAISTLLVACGGTTESTPDPAEKVTIETGVWGVLINGCDTDDCQSSPAAGTTVDALPEGASEGAEPIGSGTSDDDGFYQIDLEPGTYVLFLNSAVSTTEATVATRTRCDWESGPGGGLWTCLGE